MRVVTEQNNVNKFDGDGVSYFTVAVLFCLTASQLRRPLVLFYCHFIGGGFISLIAVTVILVIIARCHNDTPSMP